MIKSAIKILKNAPEERFFFFAKAIHLIFLHLNNCFDNICKVKKPFAPF
jgi:hypothetical protein